jgi:hypothetical protein
MPRIGIEYRQTSPDNVLATAIKYQPFETLGHEVAHAEAPTLREAIIALADDPAVCQQPRSGFLAGDYVYRPDHCEEQSVPTIHDIMKVTADSRGRYVRCEYVVDGVDVSHPADTLTRLPRCFEPDENQVQVAQDERAEQYAAVYEHVRSLWDSQPIPGF